MMKKRIYIAVTLALLTSCSMIKPIEQKNIDYVINPKIEIEAQKKSIDKITSVAYSSCSSRFNSEMFFYRVGEFQFKPYAYSKWIDSPCEMIRSSLIHALRDSKIFKNVISSKTLLFSDYEVLFSIESFEPVFDKRAFVLTNIYLILINKRNNKIVSSYSFKEKIPIKNISINNIVKTMNLSAKHLSESAVEWIRKTRLK